MKAFMVLASSLLTQWLDAKAAAPSADRGDDSLFRAFNTPLRRLAGLLLQRIHRVVDPFAPIAASMEHGDVPAPQEPAEGQAPPLVRDPNEPGSRSGEGASSLNVHIDNDAHRKTDPASGNQNGVERSARRVLVVLDIHLPGEVSTGSTRRAGAPLVACPSVFSLWSEAGRCAHA
jgi:hypothetical protein